MSEGKAKPKKMEAKLKAKDRKIPDRNKKLRGATAKLEAEKKSVTELTPTVQGLRGKLLTDDEVKSASKLGKAVELAENFLEKLNANVKSEVDYSDFKISENDLGKGLKMVGRFSVPLRLVPISERIIYTFGDITSDSSLSDCAARPSFVLFLAAIKEMDDLTLDQVDETKILLLRDAINSARTVQFKVDFAMKHLKKIARAYFGLKAMDGKISSEELLKNKDGTVRKTEVPEDYLREAKYFWGKPLSTGLLL